MRLFKLDDNTWVNPEHVTGMRFWPKGSLTTTYNDTLIVLLSDGGNCQFSGDEATRVRDALLYAFSENRP